MAHNINVENGKAAFFSYRESAWHGLGQVVNAPVTSADAIRLAGLDWSVEKQPLYRNDMTPISTHVAIVRGDTQATLGVVGADYTPVQNKELFDWFAGLDGFADVTLETAGALGMGETVWVLATCKGLRFDIGGDEHQGYMTIINGHAGNRKLVLMPTAIRIVCQNTMGMALARGKRSNDMASGWELRHTVNIGRNLDALKELYARTTQAWQNTELVLRELAKKPATDAALTRLFHEPWAAPKESQAEDVAIQRALAKQAGDVPPAEADDAALSVAAKLREETLHGIFNGKTCTEYKATRGTLFAAYNAVTEYLEHTAPTRVAKSVPAAQRERVAKLSRFTSANFGGHNDGVKRRAFQITQELAGIGA